MEGPTHRSERSQADSLAGEAGAGVAVCNVVGRAMAAAGQISGVGTAFGHHHNIKFGGVLLAVPALLSQGLGEAAKIYEPFTSGYYGLEQVFMLLGFMSLLRIKNPEQLKQCSPGELGKVLGLDRVPEVKTLRNKISLIVAQRKAAEFQSALLRKWTHDKPCVVFYIDGHVRVYSGSEANLGKKFVSRQKLCLAGTNEYWVNDQNGLPMMCVIGELNERLREAIEDRILPQLLRDTPGDPVAAQDPDTPRLTLVFDREAYEPAFFARLWNDHRVAVITYRKNVKDKWPEEDFKDVDAQVIGNIVTMRVCEKKVVLGGHGFREVRQLSEGGHQASIVTTNPKLTTAEIAGKMFSRWSQENFFKYLVENYDFDRMLQYGTEELAGQAMAVNPAYHRLSQGIKKEREKKARAEAFLLRHLQGSIDQPLEKMHELLASQAKTVARVESLQATIDAMVGERKAVPARIRLADMPEEKRYNKLKTESKLLINIVRMIAYRAETALFKLLGPFFSNNDKEGRMLVKSILSSDADLEPDLENQTLTVTIHTQSNPRSNDAASELCRLMTDVEENYPGTNLRMIFKTHADQFA